MFFIGFNKICPGVAERELQRWVVGEDPKYGVPAGVYGLLETYCVEPGCDCRRVIIHIARLAGAPGVEAVINYGWEPVEYYQKWMRDDKMGEEAAGAALERFSPQGAHAGRFLLMFREMIKHPRMNEILKRHYALAQEEIRRPSRRRALGLEDPPKRVKPPSRPRRLGGGSS